MLMGLMPGTDIEYIGGRCCAAAFSDDKRSRARDRNRLSAFEDR